MNNPENSTHTLLPDSPCTKKNARLRWTWWIAWVVAGVFIFLPFIRCVVVRGDLTPMIRFGQDFDVCAVPTLRSTPHSLQSGAGFDGQFYAQLSADPLLLKPETLPALDNVTVRARRILLPALTWALTGGHMGRILWVYPLLNLFAWIGLACLTWRLLPREAGFAAPAALLAIVLGPGAVESASRALPDLPAFLIAFASLSVPMFGGAVLLAVASLGRETTLLAWPGRVGELADWRAGWRRWFVDGLITVTPLAVWMLILNLRFGGGQRLDGTNLGLPLSGLITRLGEIAGQFSAQPIASGGDLFLHPAMQSTFLIISILAQLSYLMLRPRLEEPIWRWGMLAGVLALCLSWSTWEAFYTITRHLLPLHIAFNLLFAKSPDRQGWPWFALGNLYIIPRALYWLDYP